MNALRATSAHWLLLCLVVVWSQGCGTEPPNSGRERGGRDDLSTDMGSGTTDVSTDSLAEELGQPDTLAGTDQGVFGSDIFGTEGEGDASSAADTTSSPDLVGTADLFGFDTTPLDDAATTDILSDGHDADVQPESARVPFRNCVSAPRPQGLPTSDWNHDILSPVITLGAPWHTSNDRIAVTGKGTELTGKFAYGDISKDLEDEDVEFWIDVCEDELQLLGVDETNSDGRARLSIEAAELPSPGRYAVHLRVTGDNTWVTSYLIVVPPGTHTVVFDIDGTLTTSDTELFRDIASELFEPLLGGYVPEAREGAQEISWLRYDQGYVIQYITGRPYWLTAISRQWLRDLGFPPGALRLTDSNRDALPTDSGVGEYKADALDDLTSIGIVLNGAYGNASTDIYAYESAEVPLERTWILGSNGGDDGTVDLGDDYLDHLPLAEAEGDSPTALQR
ncbi:MAG: hypothetical protein KC561_10485 [Myxococcales bacterium]|nr:hypothetical protein [Myxococcales bacterium]